MKKLFTTFLLLCFILPALNLFAQVEWKELGNLVIENIPDIPQQLKDRIFQYQSTRSASFQDWLPCGLSTRTDCRTIISSSLAGKHSSGG